MKNLKDYEENDYLIYCINDGFEDEYYIKVNIKNAGNNGEELKPEEIEYIFAFCFYMVGLNSENTVWEFVSEIFDNCYIEYDFLGYYDELSNIEEANYYDIVIP